MANPTLTTKLEALNQILRALGETPVTAVGAGNPDDVVMAEAILDEVNREVQARGWHFNTECDVSLTADGNGDVILATNVARVDLPRRKNGNKHYTFRVDPADSLAKIYNLTDHTFDLGANATVKADVVYLYEFAHIPQQGREYITIRAGRKAQDQIGGSSKNARWTREDEFRALQQFTRDDQKTAEHTIFDNFDTWRIIDRRDAVYG